MKTINKSTIHGSVNDIRPRPKGDPVGLEGCTKPGGFYEIWEGIESYWDVHGSI